MRRRRLAQPFKSDSRRTDLALGSPERRVRARASIRAAFCLKFDKSSQTGQKELQNGLQIAELRELTVLRCWRHPMPHGRPLKSVKGQLKNLRVCRAGRQTRGNSALPPPLDDKHTTQGHVGPRTTTAKRYAKRRALYCDGELSGLDDRQAAGFARAGAAERCATSDDRAPPRRRPGSHALEVLAARQRPVLRLW